MADVKFYAKELKGQRFDDVVSLCDHVSREYGEELTLAQGRTVFNAVQQPAHRLDYHIENSTGRE